MGRAGFKGVFYAIARGRVPGVYDNWRAAKKQVDQFKGHYMNSFKTYEDAQAWLQKQWRPKDGAPEERWKVHKIAPVMHPLQLQLRSPKDDDTATVAPNPDVESTEASKEQDMDEEMRKQLEKDEMEFQLMMSEQEEHRKTDWIDQLITEPIEVAMFKNSRYMGNRDLRRTLAQLEKLKEKAAQESEKLTKHELRILQKQMKLEQKADELIARNAHLEKTREAKVKERAEKKKKMEEYIKARGGKVEEMQRVGQIVYGRTGKPVTEPAPIMTRPQPRKSEKTKLKAEAKERRRQHDPNQIEPPRIIRPSAPWRQELEIPLNERANVRISKHYGWSPLEGMRHDENGIATINSRLPKP